MEDALNTFYDGIVKYGNVPENYGVDSMVLDLQTDLDRARGQECQAKG